MDLQYSYRLPISFGEQDGPMITIGSANIFDNQPPAVATSGGFDPKVHDPRGRVIYFKVRQSLQRR